jgi:hypothetical protein
MTTLLRGAAIAAFIFGATTCLGAVPSVGSVSGPGSERIVTSALLAGGGAAVTTMAPDGSGVAKVDVPADLEDFNRSVWSHDGTRLLHSNVLVFDDSGELVAFRPALSAPDGSDYRLLRLRQRPMDFYCSAWSPDDSRILCTDIEGGVISIRATDGRGARRLTTNPFGGKDLAIGYSPDGGRVAWVREGPGSTDELERAAIFVADADGTHARRLTRWGLLGPGRVGLRRRHAARWPGDRGRRGRRRHAGPGRPGDERLRRDAGLLPRRPTPRVRDVPRSAERPLGREPRRYGSASDHPHSRSVRARPRLEMTIGSWG